MKEYNYLTGVAIIVLGLFLLLLGLKLVTATLFLAGTISIMTLVLIIFFEFFFTEGAKTSTVWIVLIVGFVLGAIASWFLLKITNVLIMAMGGYLGYLFGIFLYNLAFRHIQMDQTIIFWLTLVI